MLRQVHEKEPYLQSFQWLVFCAWQLILIIRSLKLQNIEILPMSIKKSIQLRRRNQSLKPDENRD